MTIVVQREYASYDFLLLHSRNYQKLLHQDRFYLINYAYNLRLRERLYDFAEIF